LLHDYERELMAEANKNNYANCLLFTLMAANKNKQAEQKSLFQQALGFLRDADGEE
jgi:hypothetical protein